MKNSEILLIKTMNYQHPEEIPLSIGFLPAAMKNNRDGIMDIMKRHSYLFNEYWMKYDYKKNLPISYQYGNFTDAWGCVWSNKQEGMDSYVTGHPVPRRSDVLTLKVPDTDIGLPHGFMYLRLLDLRGFEEMMLDFAEDCDELRLLIDMVCDYNIRQMEIICSRNDFSLVMVGDDLGMQRGLAIGAEKWRKYLKPAFKKIYDVCHRKNKLVYMHTDGDIIEIMPDLVEAGVNMINPQYSANGINRLVETCKGKIPIMLDLDRQLFPFASPGELRDHAREAVSKLYLPEGGLGINVEFGMDVPLENIEALVDELDKLRFYTE